MPRTMRTRVFGSCRRICTCYLRLIRSVLISMSFAAGLVRTAGLAPAASEFQARLSAADLRPASGHADRNCTCVRSLCRRPPEAARPRREVWGDRLGLHQLPRGHGPLAIYFAFCHRNWYRWCDSNAQISPSEGVASAGFGYSCMIGEPYGCRSHHDGLKGRLPRRRLTVHDLVNAAKLAFARTRLRGVALGYFAFAFVIGGAHRNRTDQAICLQGKSGFLARTPGNQKLLTATSRPIRIHWPRLSTTSRFGTAGWTRTTVSPLKRRDSRPLSYDGMGWCGVLESNQAGP